MIPESYYVDVNINYRKATPLIGSVPMSVLISKTAASTKEYTTFQQVISDYATETAPERVAAKMYFDNGGKDLLIYKQTASKSDEDTINALLQSYSNFVWVTFVEDKEISDLQTIAQALSASTQNLPKFLAQTSNIANAPTTLSAQGITNVALLFSDESSVSQPYSAIVIPAYFSGINLTEPNSLKSMVHSIVADVEPVDITTITLTNLYQGNYNVIINLGDRYVTLDGGKMVDGQPIHSAWGFAVFKKNCEDVVTDLLVQKLPYDNSSNAVIQNSLNDICNQFVTNGLIGTGKTYTGITQMVEYNGITYTTISNNDVLDDGYVVYSIPIGNATNSDKEIGKIPPVYIYAIINDVIRLVTITGEVTK